MDGGGQADRSPDRSAGGQPGEAEVVIQRADTAARRSGAVNGTYSVTEPRALANSLMPVTELWLSQVSTNRVLGPKGYASPTSRHAPLAFAVKMTAYSPGGALK